MDNENKTPIVTKKSLLAFAIIITGVAYLFFFSINLPGEPLNSEIYSDSGRELVSLWSRNEIDCIPSEKIQNDGPAGSFSIQIISVNGANEKIPANIGVLEKCNAEIYTVDSTKTVYLHPQDSNEELTLGKFFLIWGKELERSEESAYVNGGLVENPDDVVLEDGKRILLEYRRK